MTIIVINLEYKEEKIWDYTLTRTLRRTGNNPNEGSQQEGMKVL